MAKDERHLIGEVTEISHIETVSAEDDAEAIPKIEGFEVLYHLADGGMGRVFVARDKSLHRNVVLKMIGSQNMSFPGIEQRFAQEAKIVAGFRHPNIVTVYASGMVATQLYIAMEFINGGSLAEEIRDGYIDVERAVEVTRLMAGALAYSHAREVVHRDFKPANVLITKERQPVLTDFGIAKALDEGDFKTETGLLIGSPRYMSPEQMAGRRVEGRTDVYALALTFYEMLSGNTPAVELVPLRTPTQIRRFKAQLPTNCVAFGELFCRCFMEQASDRPSAAELEQQLAKWRAKKWYSRKRSMFALAGIASLLLGFVFVERESLTEDSIAAKFEISVGSPSWEQFRRFTDALDEDFQRPGLQAIQKTGFPIYDQALKIYQQRAYGEIDDNEMQQLVATARLQNPSSQLLVYLLAESGLGPVSMAEATGMLRSASDHGYGLATFYRALALRDSRGGLALDMLDEYENLLKISKVQGIDWAERMIVQIPSATGK